MSVEERRARRAEGDDRRAYQEPLRRRRRLRAGRCARKAGARRCGQEVRHHARLSHHRGGKPALQHASRQGRRRGRPSDAQAGRRAAGGCAAGTLSGGRSARESAVELGELGQVEPAHQSAMGRGPLRGLLQLLGDGERILQRATGHHGAVVGQQHGVMTGGTAATSSARRMSPGRT